MTVTIDSPAGTLATGVPAGLPSLRSMTLRRCTARTWCSASCGPPPDAGMTAHGPGGQRLPVQGYRYAALVARLNALEAVPARHREGRQR